MTTPLSPAAGDTSANGSRESGIGTAPGFMVLLPLTLTNPFSSFGPLPPGFTPLPVDQAQNYQELFADFEKRLLGEVFLAARRITRFPVGRISLDGAPDRAPNHADLSLLVHASGVALWEAWLPAADQPFDAQRWISWLDTEVTNNLVSLIWQHVAPLNEHLTGSAELPSSAYPISVLRAPDLSIDALRTHHAADLVRLLFLNRDKWVMKQQLIDGELDRDYCPRSSGMSLFSRRSGLDLHGQGSPLEPADSNTDMPPSMAVPFVITLEMLHLERATLRQLYERLSHGPPRSVDDLLLLKRQVMDSMEEYFGAIANATRFSDAIIADGEKLFGITDLYDAVMIRLEAVSFEITMSYQKRMTTLQFWLTIVFGATEIGFIASGIATWYYHSELLAVLSWTLGAAVVSGVGLVALLRGRLV